MGKPITNQEMRDLRAAMKRAPIVIEAEADVTHLIGRLLNTLETTEHERDEAREALQQAQQACRETLRTLELEGFRKALDWDAARLCRRVLGLPEELSAYRAALGKGGR